MKRPFHISSSFQRRHNIEEGRQPTMSSIRRYCGFPENGTFELYLNKDRTFGRCFLWTTFSSVSHVLLALVSSYLLGSSKKVLGVRRSCTVVVATSLAILSMLVIIAELVLSYLLHHPHQHPPAYVLARTVAFTSWCLCSLFCWKCRVNDGRTRKNFKILLLAMVFVLLSSSMQLQSVDQHIALEKYSSADVPVDFFGVIVGFTLQLYLSGRYVPCIKPVCNLYKLLISIFIF